VAGDTDTSFVERLLGEGDGDGSPRDHVELAVTAAAIAALRERTASRLRPTSGTVRSPWWEAGLREAHGRRGG
jgi:hypothetical protein